MIHTYNGHYKCCVYTEIKLNPAPALMSAEMFTTSMFNINLVVIVVFIAKGKAIYIPFV